MIPDADCLIGWVMEAGLVRDSVCSVLGGPDESASPTGRILTSAEDELKWLSNASWSVRTSEASIWSSWWIDFSISSPRPDGLGCLGSAVGTVERVVDDPSVTPTFSRRWLRMAESERAEVPPQTDAGTA